MYSVRQLTARDSGADFAKSKRTLLAPVTSGATRPAPDCQTVLTNDDDERITAAKETIVDDESRSDDRPLAVTASIFRSTNAGFPKQAQEKTSVRTSKSPKQVDESLKENDEPAAADRPDCCRPAFARTPFLLQVRWTFQANFYSISLNF